MTDHGFGRHRVVHIGTGLTGREALRATILDPALDLVGIKVSTPSKVGTDAGRLCGVADVGVTATDDMAEIIALKPDCVSYCATAVRREEDAIADIAAAGIRDQRRYNLDHPDGLPAGCAETLAYRARFGREEGQFDPLRYG